jgi:ABC-type uncharacterized transport system permease subunit
MGLKLTGKNMKTTKKSSSLKALVPLPLEGFAGFIVLALFTACANYNPGRNMAWLFTGPFSSIFSIILFILKTEREDTCKSSNSK